MSSFIALDISPQSFAHVCSSLLGNIPQPFAVQSCHFQLLCSQLSAVLGEAGAALVLYCVTRDWRGHTAGTEVLGAGDLLLVDFAHRMG